MCVCLYVCLGITVRYACVHVVMCIHECMVYVKNWCLLTSLVPLFLIILNRVPHWSWSSYCLSWPVCSRGSSCCCTVAAGVLNQAWFSHRCWGSEFKIARLCSKHFTNSDFHDPPVYFNFHVSRTSLNQVEMAVMLMTKVIDDRKKKEMGEGDGRRKDEGEGGEGRKKGGGRAAEVTVQQQWCCKGDRGCPPVSEQTERLEETVFVTGKKAELLHRILTFCL